MDLLARMLSKNPATRITIDRIKLHPFFKDIDWQKLVNRQVKPSLMLEMDAPGTEQMDDEDAYLAMGIAKGNFQDK
jgi:serine/threonine protein kinase